MAVVKNRSTPEAQPPQDGIFEHLLDLYDHDALLRDDLLRASVALRAGAPAAGSAERDVMWFATQVDKLIEHVLTTIGDSPDVLFALKAVQHDIATMAALAGTDTDVAKEK